MNGLPANRSTQITIQQGDLGTIEKTHYSINEWERVCPNFDPVLYRYRAGRQLVGFSSNTRLHGIYTLYT